MNLIASGPLPVRQFAARLRQRQGELGALLHASAGEGLATEAVREVQDFKDVAAQDTRAAVDEVGRALAARELGQIAAALRRVDAGIYGECEDCGEAIDRRRLLALPATAFCTACQAIRERPAL